MNSEMQATDRFNWGRVDYCVGETVVLLCVFVSLKVKQMEAVMLCENEKNDEEKET